MVKKILLGAVIVVGLGALLVGTEATSYFRTSWGKAKQSVKDSVPIEFQIDRARQMVKDIEPEVRNAMQAIARQEVEAVEGADPKCAVLRQVSAWNLAGPWCDCSPTARFTSRSRRTYVGEMYSSSSPRAIPSRTT